LATFWAIAWVTF
jgi:hypothetical protein